MKDQQSLLVPQRYSNRLGVLLFDPASSSLPDQETCFSQTAEAEIAELCVFEGCFEWREMDVLFLELVFFFFWGGGVLCFTVNFDALF